jgi:hypothetical protein
MNATLKRTRFVSFPRSGHHWLVSLLSHALGDRLQYSEMYTGGGTLESNPNINLQKTHDFDLSTPVSDEYQHLVLVRPFNECVLSWFLMEGPKAPFFNDFGAFARAQHRFYKAFMAKWADGPVPNRLLIRYTELRENCVETLAGVLCHMGLPYEERVDAAYTGALRAPPKSYT